MTPRDPDWRTRTEASFGSQPAMRTLGITVEEIAPGRVTLTMPFAQHVTQHHGYVHAGVLATALDSACGYAAYTLMERGAEVLTIEFKINLLAPAKGQRFRFAAEVIRAGRTITAAEARAFAIENGVETLIATMSATLIAARPKPS